MTKYINRERLAATVGIDADNPNYKQAIADYRPATIGRNCSLVQPTRFVADVATDSNVDLKCYGNQFCGLDFFNVEEMRNYHLSTATAQPLYADINGQHVKVEGQNIIVDDETHQMYGIHSDKYHVVQHDFIKEAMAFACEDTDMSVVGHFDQHDGRMNGYATFANPDCHIDLGVHYNDPVMLGMRFFNSHNGDSRVGGTIFGIRKVCGNYMAWGETLGTVSIMHFKGVENVAKELGAVLKDFRAEIPALEACVHTAQEEILNPEEQIDALWGIGLAPHQIDAIYNNRASLNPENTHIEAFTVYDLYNASTAYATYRSGSANKVNGNLNLSNKIEGMLRLPRDKLVAKGIRIREEYEARQNALAQRRATNLVVRAVA